MSVRQHINSRPWCSYAAGAILIIFAVGFVIRSQSAGRPVIILNKECYFTTDDGKTTFVDSVTRPTPFRLSDGREAFLAHVFTRNGDDRFVAFLERDDGGTLGNVKQQAGSSAPISLASRMVKRPGDNAWVQMTSRDGMKIMNVRGSDGTEATQVLPGSE